MVHRKAVSGLVVTAVVLVAGVIGARSAPAPDKPVFARVSVTQDDSRVLSVAFLTSDGTVYDTMFADANFNRRFEASEKMSAKIYRPDSTHVLAFFPPVKLPVDFSRSVAGTADHPNTVHLQYESASRPGSAGVFKCQRRLAAGRGRTCALVAPVETASTLQRAPVVGFGKAPTIALQTKPDDRKPGNTGFVAHVMLGKWEVWGAGMPVTIVVRRPNGEVVHKGSGDISSFVFG